MKLKTIPQNLKRKNTSKSVSVVIASYNRKNFLKECLMAIDSQKFKGYLEVIVVDDGSADGALEILEHKSAGSNKFVFKYFRTSHAGPATARNLGIANAKGEIIIFLDDDSIIQTADYVSKITESFSEKGIGIVAGKTEDFYSGILKFIRVGDPPEVNFDKPEKLQEAVGVPTKNAAFLKEAIEKVGGFNPAFKYALGEDIDLCIRILKQGYKLAFNREALVYHYPAYNFGGYVKKSYCRGFSYGIFRSAHPEKSHKFSLLKAIIFPILAVRNFIRKFKECHSRKLFSDSILKESLLMYFLINASYCALYLGEINYLLENFIFSIKIRLKVFKDLIKYFFESVKYFIKSVFPFRRRNFIIYLTNRCNQHCRHCFYSQDINKNTQELSFEDLKKIAENYYQYTNIRNFFARNICQGFTGGEPFLRNDLLDVIFLFKKAGVRHFQINTNGMLTDKIVFLGKELLKNGISHKIIISIDGLEKTHDKIRNTPGAFRKAAQTIKGLKNIGADVGAIMTINGFNYKETKETVKFLNESFGIEPGLQLIRGVSQSNVPAKIRGASSPLDKELLITKEIIPEIKDILYKIYLNKSIENPLRIMEFARKFTYLQSHLGIIESSKKIFDCAAGKSVGVIYQNGDVSLCEFLKPIGNLKEANFNLPFLWNNSLARNQREFIENCFCNHDCFINTEYNLKFLKYLTRNLNGFIVSVLKKI